MISRSQMNRQLYQYGTGLETEDYVPDMSTTGPGGLEYLFRNNEYFPPYGGDTTVIPSNVPGSDFKTIDEDLKEMKMTEDDIKVMREYLKKLKINNKLNYATGGMVNRQNYGLGSFVKSIVKSVKKVADPVAQVASFVPGPWQPFATAYTTARGLGVGGGGYGGLKIGKFAPSGGALNFLGSFASGAPQAGLQSFLSTQGMPNVTNFLGNLGVSPNIANLFTTDQFGIGRLQNAMTSFGTDVLGEFGPSLTSYGGAPYGSDALGEFGQASRVLSTPSYGSDMLGEFGPSLSSYSSAANTGSSNFLQRISDTFKGAPQKVFSVLEDFVKKGDTKNALTLASLGKTALSATGAYLSYKDQKRLNEIQQKAYEDLKSKQEGYRTQFASDQFGVTGTGRTKADVIGRRGIAAFGGYGMDIPMRTNQAGVTEMDLRESGGFIPPVGIKEKADDIPAMLSNNEFVFTADAVRAAGGGSVDKGAQNMYALMKNLEAQA